MSLTVASVLRSGGPYAPCDVQRLARAVERHLARFDRFVCLSDLAVPGVDCVPLLHGWPRFWAKIELFRPAIFDADRVLYLDLDTIITGSLDDIAARPEPFLGLMDFYRKPPKCPARFASGLMLWTPGYRAIYDGFRTAPNEIMNACRFGDQQWIERHIEPTFWQDVLPGQAVSYKVDIRDKGLTEPPRDARAVCFHGRPRPFEVKDYWVCDYWQEAALCRT